MFEKDRKDVVNGKHRQEIYSEFAGQGICNI